MKTAIPEQRLHNQRITRAVHRQPADVVAWLGAVQAQEYPAARWALALRMPPGTTDPEIERALDEGRILRTHVMRPTWHFVTPADIHWMLELTAPRVHQAMSYYRRQHGLETAILNRATAAFERALRDGQCLTRAELGAQLERAGPMKNAKNATKVASGIPLALLTIYAELEGVICSGPRRGKQLTYALLPERAPRTPRLSRDEALAELTRRYFRSHGPATIRDFVWWSGLTNADAKRGLEMNKARDEVVDGRTCRGPRRGPHARQPRVDPARQPRRGGLLDHRPQANRPHGPRNRSSAACVRRVPRGVSRS